MFHKDIENHCYHVIDALIKWLNETKTLQWYEHDIYKHDEMDENYLMLRVCYFFHSGLIQNFMTY